MKAFENFENTEARNFGEFETLEPGGYICKIKEAEITTSKSNKEMLVISFDIAEGEKKGFYERRFKEASEKNTDISNPTKWSGIYRQLIEGENADKYFKGLITSLEASNPGFNWSNCNWDESKLKGLKFGGIFGEEEYYKTDDSIGTSVKIKNIRSVNVIKNGEFKIPAVKKVQPRENPFSPTATSTIVDDDLPF